MRNPDRYKSAIQLIDDEFPRSRRLILPPALRRAHRAADELIKENFFLKTPPLRFLRGHLVTWAMEYEFANLCEMGNLPFHVSWPYYQKPTGRYLRMDSERAVITISQLPQRAAVPRKAKFRKNQAYNNEPFLLPDLEETRLEAMGDKPHLLIGHGYHSPDFIQIGMPHPEYPGYIYRTPNILDELRVHGAETIPSEDAPSRGEPSLKESIKERLRKQMEDNQEIAE